MEGLGTCTKRASRNNGGGAPNSLLVLFANVGNLIMNL